MSRGTPSTGPCSPNVHPFLLTYRCKTVYDHSVVLVHIVATEPVIFTFFLFKMLIIIQISIDATISENDYVCVCAFIYSITNMTQSYMIITPFTFTLQFRNVTVSNRKIKYQG